MKRLLSMFMALMLCLSLLPASAEYGVIGGADGPTEIFVTTVKSNPLVLPGDLAAQAVAAGRRVETEVKITGMNGIDTSDETLDAALRELLESIAVRTARQGNETGLTLTIGETDVLTLAYAAAEDGAYIGSNLLGGTIAVREDEVGSLVSRVMNMMVQLNMLDETTASAMNTAIAELEDAAGLLGVSASGTAFLTMEDLLAVDHSAVLAVLEDVLAGAETIESPTVPERCDPAVSGTRVSMTNEQMMRLIKAYIQVLRDHPELMRVVANMLGMYTEEQLSVLWQEIEDIGAAITEEELRMYYPSFEAVLDGVEAELEGQQLLDGTYDIQVCYGEDGQVVYMTATLPLALYSENETDDGGETHTAGTPTVLSAEYTRQTLSEGVSHVVTFFVDEDSVTMDALVKDGSAHIEFSAQDAPPVTLDVVWADGTVSAVLLIRSNEEMADIFAFEGTYLCTDESYKLSGKLTYTDVVNSAYQGLDVSWNFAASFSAEYVRNGVDFEGTFDAGIAFEDVNLALQGTTRTTDPAESIVTEDALRPAEMEDEAFINWFVKVLNNFNAWMGTVLMALPESLLSILMSGNL